MNETPEVSIVIVNWRSVDYLRECLTSVRKETSSTRYEVIVVDNASYDGSDKLLAREFPETIFVQSKTNSGFARANNLGVRHANGRILLFLNPDTKVLGPAVDQLVHAFNQLANPGVLGCRLLNTDGTLQTSCVQSFPTILNQFLSADILRNAFPKSSLWGTQVLYEPADHPREVDAISGACMMIERRVFDQVGGFSTDYFMYAEDIDLCYKLREAGYRNYYFSGAEVVHHGGGSSRQTSGFSNAMLRESAWLYFRKHHGRLQAWGYRCAMLALAALRLGMLVITWPWFMTSRKRAFWAGCYRKWFAILAWAAGSSPKPT